MKAFLVSEDVEFLKKAKTFLEKKMDGLSVDTAMSPEDALEKLGDGRYDAVISTCYSNHGMDCFEFLKEMKRKDENLPFIMMTGEDEEKIGIESIEMGADRNVICKGSKDIHLMGLLNAVEQEIELKRVEKELKESERFYKIMYDVMLVLSKHDDIDYLLATIAHEARSLLKATDCNIYIYDEEEKVLRPIYSNHPKYYKEIMEHPIPLGEGLSGMVAENKIGRYINYDDPDYISISIPETDQEEEELESIMAVPMLEGDELQGVISVGKMGDTFDDDDMGKLKLFARQAEIAFNKVRYIEEIQGSHDEMKEEKEKVKKLHDIAVEMKSVRSEDELYDLIIKGVNDILEFDVCSIDMLIEGKFEVKRTIRGLNREGDRYPVTGVAGETLKTNRSFLINDVQGSDLAEPVRRSYMSAISVPIGDIGVFQALSEVKDDFDGDDVEMTEMLMAHATQSIERLRNYEEKVESEKKYRGLFESSPIYLWEMDFSDALPKLREFKKNNSLEEIKKIMQRDEETFVSMGDAIKINEANELALDLYNVDNIVDIKERMAEHFIFGKGKEGLFDLLEALLDGYNSGRSEVPFESEEGTKYLTIQWSVVPGHEEDYSRVLVSGIDTTESKEMAEEIQKSEEKYRTIFETAKDAIFVMKDDIFIDCNEKTLEIFDCSRDDILDQPPYVFSPEKQPDGRDSEDKAFEKINAALEGEPQTFEWLHTTLHGEQVYTEVSLNKYTMGNEDYIMAIVRDITDRKETEETLRESEHKFKTLAEMSPFSIFVYRDKFLYVNDASERLTGYTKEELLTKKFWEVVDPDHREMVKERGFARVRGNNIIPSYEFKIQRKNGQSRWIYFTGGKINYEGESAGLGTAIDITNMKSIQDELEQYKNQLEELVNEKTAELREANEELEAYTHSISHDLKAPLRAIQGFSEELLKEHKGSMDQDAIDCLERIIHASQRMDDLIDNLLTYSRVAKSSKDLRRVSLEEAISECIDDFEDIIEDRGVSLKVSGELPDVHGRHTDLVQIFSNLISNALKFVDEGVTPKVRIWTEEHDGYIRIWVEDNGIGIPEDKQEDIFELFERLHSRDKYPGTGVGLSIVSKAVRRMDGRVGVQSIMGEGSKFCIDLRRYD